MDARDLVRAVAEGASAAAAEAMKQAFRRREAAAHDRKSAIAREAREVDRLSLVLLKAEGELEREEYDEAFDRCEAEIKTWGQPGEPEDWVDNEEIIDLRVQIVEIFDSLDEEEEKDKDFED